MDKHTQARAETLPRTHARSRNKHPSGGKNKKVKAAKTQRRKAGRSSSPSQGQWHTSAWIITLSHSASRQRITSCTEASAGAGRRRRRRLEVGDEEQTNTFLSATRFLLSFLLPLFVPPTTGSDTQVASLWPSSWSSSFRCRSHHYHPHHHHRRRRYSAACCFEQNVRLVAQGRSRMNIACRRAPSSFLTADATGAMQYSARPVRGGIERTPPSRSSLHTCSCERRCRQHMWVGGVWLGGGIDKAPAGSSIKKKYGWRFQRRCAL